MITLKTLPQATTQEVFDQVVNHLRKQNAKSERVVNAGMPNETGECVYRAGNGAKCAAGCLIGDDEYDPALEGYTWKQLVNNGKVPAFHEWLIQELQAIHDGHSVHRWESQIRMFAENENLRYTAPC